MIRRPNRFGAGECMSAAASPRRPISEDAFLDAATELFARQGYGATSVDQIALRAGSTKPTLYARFASKEELYARAVEREAALLTRHLFAAYDRAEREGLREGVSLGMRAAFEFAELRPDGLGAPVRARYVSAARRCERARGAAGDRPRRADHAPDPGR